MFEPINTDTIAKPASHYNHGLYVPAGLGLLSLSGQLGERPDGSCPADAYEQSIQAWQNVLAILAQKNLGIENIIKVTSYIVGEEPIGAYVQAHREIVEGHKPPWTLVVVKALGNPQYLVEVDVLAAG